MALSSGPALAKDQGPGIDYPEVPTAVIAPGQTGPVTFGIKNTTETSITSDGPTHLTVTAPNGTVFADNTVTPIGTAAGPWSCTLKYSNTWMDCTSDYKGVIVPAGEVWQWRVNITVNSNAPYDDTPVPGFASLYYPSGGQVVWNATGPASVRVRTPPCQGADCPVDTTAVIAPGTSGTATFGLKNDSDKIPSDEQLYLSVWAPPHTTFTDDTVTAIGDAPGPWSCVREFNNIRLRCVSDWKGVPVPTGETRQWQVHLAVDSDAPYNTTLIGQGALLEWCGSYVVSSNQGNPETLRVKTGPPPA
ncbi:hypothetical protein [Streptomyces melanogenes]|uniref:hypothetical protein n=1 Tax=Streptomyces melanogenes TaxID=67326 RepID=UPI00167CF88E|nr:hypothetical protein [Streptomyces melanogenes]